MEWNKSDLTDFARQAEVMLEASVTEDLVGAVLRIHLVTEEILNWFLQKRIGADQAAYVKMPRNFVDKLGLAVAFDLPLELAAVMHQVNVIRNKIAHRMNASIGHGDMAQLTRVVDNLRVLNPQNLPLAERSLHRFDGPDKVSVKFGHGNVRVDFLLAFGSFWWVTLQWLTGGPPEAEV